MFGKTKRMLALLLALSMLFSMMSMGVSATEAGDPTPESTSDFPVLTPGTRQNVELDGVSNTMAFFSFTPEEDGYYAFTSHSDMDTYGHLFDADMNELKNDDDGAGIGNNFLVSQFLSAGITYIFGARFYDETLAGTFEVSITKSPIVSVSVAPVEILPDTNCSVAGAFLDNDWLRYSNYSWWDCMNVTVTMENDDIVAFTGRSFVYNGITYEASHSNSQSSENIWQPGNTYTETVSFGGISADVSVTILPSPAESITLYDLDMPEHNLGEQRYYWDEELGQDVPLCYVYYWYNFVDGTITLKDGTQLPIVDGEYEYDGQVYCILDFSNQQDEGGWELGNTYTPTVSALGVSCQANVSIVETIVSDVQINPITIMKNENGGFITDEGSSEEYFHYNWQDCISGTITLKDGTQLELIGIGFNYGDSHYEIQRQDTQSADNAWVGGNTYTATVTVLGYTKSVDVTIEDSPVSQVIVNDLTFTEGTHGYLDHNINDGIRDDFFKYSWWDYMSGTVVMRNGDRIDFQGADFDLNGEWVGISLNDRQGLEHWYAGNTYTASFNVMGQDASFEVTIEESPVTGVSVAPIEIMEGCDGITTQHYDDQTGSFDEYYEYHWWNRVYGTVTFSDGTTADLYGTNIYYNDQSYDAHFTNDQHITHWSANETHEVSYYLLGQWVTVEVSIVPSPVTQISLNPVTIIENTNGYESFYWDEAQQMQLPYYHYNWDTMLTGTVTFSDGGTAQLFGNWFSYNGQDYYLSTPGTQQTGPWIAGSTYDVYMSGYGLTPHTSVTIIPRPGIETYPQLSLSTPYSVTVSPTTPKVYLTFTPAENTMYTFSSSGAYTTAAMLYNGDWSIFSEARGDGPNNNFNMVVPLTAGNTYILEVGMNDDVLRDYFTFDVSVSTSPIQSIMLDPITMVENIGGGMGAYIDPNTQTEVEAYRYYWWELLRGTVYFKDGTSTPIEGTGFYHNGQYYSLSYSDPQDVSAWTAGNSYHVMFSVAGTMTGVSVQIISCPITNIALDPITIVENSCGYTETNVPEPFYWYNWHQKLTGTVYFNDGTSSTINGNSFNYHGQMYSFNWTDPQNDAPWTVGNNYNVTISAFGYNVAVNVSIVASPVTSITANPIVLMENSGGYWNTYWNEQTETQESYYHYQFIHMLSGTVTFSDGTSAPLHGNTIYYQGQQFTIEFADTQISDHWTVGNTYQVYCSIGNTVFFLPVQIQGIPFASIVLDPISFTKETGGHWNNMWNDATQSFEDYYHYDWQPRLSGTAFVENGDPIRFYGNSISYNGQDYFLSFGPDNQFMQHWTEGNSYTVPVSLGNFNLSVQITINGYPDASTLPQLPENALYTVQLDAITTEAYLAFTPSQSGIYILNSNGHNDTYGTLYDDQWNPINEDDDNGTNSNFMICQPLTAGQTYIIAARFLASGSVGSFEIQAQLTPIASIRVDPMSLFENTNGHMDMRYNPETMIEEPYYHYDWCHSASGIVYFTDGSSVNFYGTNFFYNGVSYELGFGDDQQMMPWTKGGTYYANMHCMGIGTQFQVEIATKPVVSMEFDPVILAENVGGYESGGWVDGQYVPYFHYTDWMSMLSGTVYFNDGTSAPINGTTFMYQGSQYGIQSNSDQSANNPWLPGRTYAVEMSVMGVTAQVNITVCQSVTADGFTYIQQDGKVIISDCTLTDKVLNIPETIGGYPVVGILSLSSAMEYAQELHIPDSVTMLSDNAISWYGSPLKKLYIGAGITNLQGTMVFGMQNLEYIEVSENNPAFKSIAGVVYDKDITQLVLMPTVYSTTYHVPDSVTDIDLLIRFPEVFAQVKFLPGAGVTHMTDIDGVVYDSAVTKVYSIIKERTGDLVLPETVVAIHSHALAYSNLGSITIPESVTDIAYGAFYGSTSLQSVNLPDSIDSISMNAFRDCSSLESITIPSGCNYVSMGSFNGCTGLEAVHVDSLDAWCHTIFGDVEANPLYYAGNLYVDDKLVTDLVIPASVGTLVYDNAFAGINVSSITVPATVYTIGTSAFEGSTAAQIELPQKLQYIDTDAFANSGLTSVTLPDSLQMTGWNCFAGCAQLKNVNFGNGLTSVTRGMFARSGLEQIALPQQISYVGYAAFADCHNLTDVTFENDALEIDDEAFLNCGLRQIDLPSNMSYYGWNTFEGTDLATVTLPDTVTGITYRTFAFSENLMSVVIPTSVTEVWNNAFDGCTSLGHLLYEGDQEQWNHVEIYSPEAQAAQLHLNASAEDITVNYYCHQIQHYCAVCNEWQYKDLDGMHNYVDSVCTLCGYNEYSAVVNGESFETLDEALEAADTGDTIALNNNIATDELVLESGAQLDLNGSTLIVSDGIVVLDGEIYDSTEGEAALVIEKDALVLPSDNTQMPLYDTTTGSYRFYSYTVTVKGVRENADGTVTYGFRFDFGGRSAYEVLQETENSGIAGNFTLNWTGGGQQSFSFGDELIRQYAQLTQRYGDMAALMVNITGLDTLESGTELTAYAAIASDRGMYKTGDDIVYTTPAQ